MNMKNPFRSIVRKFFPVNPQVELPPELEARATSLLGLDPKRPERSGQVVPQELVARMHALHMALGSNASIGYETDDFSESWEEYYEYFDWAIQRVIDEMDLLDHLKTKTRYVDNPK